MRGSLRGHEWSPVRRESRRIARISCEFDVTPEYGGNRQLIITVGSLSVNDRVSLFLMDYPNRTRLKMLGHARVEGTAAHAELVAAMARLDPEGPIERVIVIDVLSFDWNCPKHITPRFTAAQINPVIDSLRRRIAELEAELAARPADEKA